MREADHYAVTLHDPYSGWRKEVMAVDSWWARIAAVDHARLFGTWPHYDLLFTHDGKRITVELQDKWDRGIIALLATIEARSA
jgi:hypothetical protein